MDEANHQEPDIDAQPMDEHEAEALMEALSSKPLEQRATVVEALAVRLERELEATGGPHPSPKDVQ